MPHIGCCKPRAWHIVNTYEMFVELVKSDSLLKRVGFQVALPVHFIDLHIMEFCDPSKLVVFF